MPGGLSSSSSSSDGGGGGGTARPKDFTLRLDASGNEVDAAGNVVRVDTTAVRSLRVNVGAAGAAPKRVNPYLAHLGTAAASSSSSSEKGTSGYSSVAPPQQKGDGGGGAEGEGLAIDPRIATKSWAARGKPF